MKKEEFINLIASKGALPKSPEDKASLSLVYEKLQLHIRTGKTTYCNNFYTPNIWKALESLGEKLDTNIFTFGVFKDAERKLIAFSSEEPYEYPIVLLKITNKSKFYSVCHKDYLGAIMCLGIKREKLGDIIVQENCAYVPLHYELGEYIKNNLDSIGRSNCIIDEIDIFSKEIPEYLFEEVVENVSSLRLDCVVGAICNISRSVAQNNIKEGKVLIDYKVEYRKDFTLLYNSTLTIRGYGKFKISEVLGKTKSERIKVLIKKFV